MLAASWRDDKRITMAAPETLFKDKKIEVDVMFDTVSIRIHCGDDYEAQVLFDDITQRLQSGEGLVVHAEGGIGQSVQGSKE